MIEALDLFRSLNISKNLAFQKPAFQKQAWELFEEKGLPQKNQEAFQYLSLRKFYDSLLVPVEKSSQSVCEDFSSLLLPESQDSYLILRDGAFCPKLSKLPSSLIVLPLEEALEKSSYSAFLRRHMDLLIRQEKDPLSLLNAALCQGGVFIYVPPKMHLVAPIQVIHIQSDLSSRYVGPRIHLFLGAHSKVQMVSSFQTQESSRALYNDFLDVSLEEHASFSHVFSTEKKSSAWGFSSFRATLKKDSHLSSCFVTLDSSGFRRDYAVYLLGERAEADLKGLTVLNSSLESHVHVLMEHSAPFCKSHQFFKNVLAGQSRSSFTGKIYVKRAAQKTEAYQLNQNLLLSDQAIANTKPNLEIFADDVKASHGATVSQIDEDQVFYLRTRGVPLLTAKSLLTMGFCQEVLDSIAFSSLRNSLSSLCRQFLLKQG